MWRFQFRNRRCALRASAASLPGLRPGQPDKTVNLGLAPQRDPAADGMPNDVLIVEDDPIIALDFEDTLLGFGVKTVRTARSVAGALQMIAERQPNFALL